MNLSAYFYRRMTTLAVSACLLPMAGLSLWVGSVSVAQAETAVVDQSAPDVLIRTLIQDVMNTVRNDKTMQAGNLDKVTQLVDQRILPHANFQKTTQLAMGRHWAKASPEQQKQISQEFKTLLIRTYAGAVNQVRDMQVQFKPARMAPEDTDVIIRTQMINRGEPMQLDYRLEKTANGWKVYDVNVLGIWLVESYKTQFNEAITKSGIDGLLHFLHEKNRLALVPAKA
jgi:phospholipid transport system substrate-binding protein